VEVKLDRATQTEASEVRFLRGVARCRTQEEEEEEEEEEGIGGKVIFVSQIKRLILIG
jgi:hypothetical protein